MEHEQLTSNGAKLEGGFRGEWKARKEQKARLREGKFYQKASFSYADEEERRRKKGN